MSFLELAKSRRSVRSYAETRVDLELVDRCIEAARIAPSASNSQPWSFVVVTDDRLRRELGAASLLKPSKMNRFVASAPVIIALVVERLPVPVAAARVVKQIDYSLVDAGIAASHLCLEATEIGLGTCMIGWFNVAAVRRILGIPRSRRIAMLITVGYPERPLEPAEKSRRRIDSIRSYDAYRKSEIGNAIPETE